MQGRENISIKHTKFKQMESQQSAATTLSYDSGQRMWRKARQRVVLAGQRPGQLTAAGTVLLSGGGHCSHDSGVNPEYDEPGETIPVPW